VHLVPAIIVVGGILFILTRVALETPWKETESHSFEPTSAKIGTLLMTDYLIPFEIASVLLLAALIGAAFIARKES
jgi:NADH:ubiquinone oxidoreductase subunit 6 (subunit J)